MVVPCAALRRRDTVDPFGRSRKAGRPFDQKIDSGGCATVQIPARETQLACILHSGRLVMGWESSEALWEW